MKGLKGKLALVTGGGNGIGLAISRRLAEEGCTVGILDIDVPAASAACEAIKASGGSAFPLQADICNYEAVDAAVRAFVAEQKRDIDILVNNAGWDRFGPFVKQAREDWQKVIGINLIGMMNVSHIVIPAMIAKASGKVVNIASDAGRVGSSGETAYAASKGGVIAFSKSMAREVAGKNITVNAVCPGPTETNMSREVANSSPAPEKLQAALLRLIPMRRMGQPDDVAGIVGFLASDDSAYITGQVISVSGGLTMSG